MAKPSSEDLRARVVAAVERGGLSRREAARRFGVGVSTAVRWTRRWREKGLVAPGQMGGHRPKKITGSWRNWLLERCHGGAFTLRGLVKELGERGLKVDYRCVWAVVHAEGLTYKKDFARQRAGPRRCGPTAGPMADIPWRCRSQAAGLHR